jgi:hypothetical protein
MKTLQNIKLTATGSKLTLTDDVVDKDFYGNPMQQQTVTYMDDVNPRHVLHCQISNAAVFVRMPGKQAGMAIEIPALVEAAKQIEPLLNYPPQFSSQITADTLKADIGSELTPDLQWEFSDDGRHWFKIEGQTTATLDKSTVKPGQYVHLVASSEAGSATSNYVRI